MGTKVLQIIGGAKHSAVVAEVNDLHRKMTTSKFGVDMVGLNFQCSSNMKQLAVTLVMIERCPHLREVSIKLKMHTRREDTNCEVVTDYVEGWQLSDRGLGALDKFTVKNFTGPAVEMSYMLYVLSQPYNLEKMTIFCFEEFVQDPQQSHKKLQIKTYPASSGFERIRLKNKPVPPVILGV